MVSALESVNELTTVSGPWPFLITEILLSLFFTVEAVVRVSSYIPFRKARSNIFIWLDVLTILPFWMRA